MTPPSSDADTVARRIREEELQLAREREAVRAEKQRLEEERQRLEQQRMEAARPFPEPKTPGAAPQRMTPSAAFIAPSLTSPGRQQRPQQRRRESSPSSLPSPSSADQTVGPIPAPDGPAGLRQRLAAAWHSLLSFLFRLAAVLSVLLLLLLALQQPTVRHWLRLDHPTVFCPSESSTALQLPGGGDALPCTPCPAHGFCDDDGGLRCDRLYLRQGDVCMRDSAHMRKAAEFKRGFVQQLQTQKGQFECQHSDRKESATLHCNTRPLRPLSLPSAALCSSTTAADWAVSASTLCASCCRLTGQQLLDGTTFASPWWSWRELTELELAALKEQFYTGLELLTEDRETVLSSFNISRPTPLLSARFEAVTGSHPLLCSLRLTAWDNRGKLLLLTLAVSVLQYAHYRIRRWLRRRADQQQMVALVRQRLSSHPDSAIAVDHLRDDLWTQPHDGHRFPRDAELWQRVEAEVNGDSRVESTRSRVGNIHREAWRWVGPPPPPAKGTADAAGMKPSPLPQPHSSTPRTAQPAPPPPQQLPSSQPTVAASSFGEEFRGLPVLAPQAVGRGEGAGGRLEGDRLSAAAFPSGSTGASTRSSQLSSCVLA